MKRMLYRTDYIDSKKHLVVDDELCFEKIKSGEWHKSPIEAAEAYLKTLKTEKEELYQKKENELEKTKKKSKAKKTKVKESKEEG